MNKVSLLMLLIGIVAGIVKVFWGIPGGFFGWVLPVLLIVLGVITGGKD